MNRYALILLAALGVIATHPAMGDPTALQTKRAQSSPLLAPATEPEVPDPEQAFRVSVSARDVSTLVVRFDVDDCCYLYRDKIKLSIVTADGNATSSARLGNYTLPSGKVKTDQFIGNTEVYYGSVEFDVPMESTASGLALKVGYQGCSEKGIQICFPPETKLLSIDAPGTGTAAANSGGGFWLALIAALGAGLLLSFTPCVLPMIPILSGVIVGAEGTHLTKLRGGLLSYTYVLGTAVTYTIAGAIAGTTGEQLQAYFQNAWAIGIFSAVLVLLALSMFGFYTLQVPASIQSLLHSHSTRLRHRAQRWVAGEYIGVFLLGLVSALIIGACVSPVLVSVLAGAVAARDPWLGAGVMFALAHGQGAVLVALGISEGMLLPKAGPWMDTIKHVFGVLLIAVAIYLLGFLPQVPVLLLWGTLLIICAVYLGATQRLPDNASGWRYLWKGVGTVLLVWGILALLGGFAGKRDIFSPLPVSWFDGKTVSVAHEPAFERVKTLRQLEMRLADAKAAGKPVVLDYYADWCTDCQSMEQSTFIDADVRAELAKRFVALQADVTDTDHPDIKALKDRFGVFGPPAILFFASNGNEHKEMRAYGYTGAADLRALLRRVE